MRWLTGLPLLMRAIGPAILGASNAPRHVRGPVDRLTCARGIAVATVVAWRTHRADLVTAWAGLGAGEGPEMVQLAGDLCAPSCLWSSAWHKAGGLNVEVACCK